MKKILVILLILAVGTGVFAQGTWTLGGGGQIGARVDFNVDPAITNAAAYNSWENVNGNMSIGYSLGGFAGSVDLNTADVLEGEASLTGENYKFLFAGQLWRFLANNTDKDASKNTRLWGEYKLFNGMATLEAAYNSRDTEYWMSDKTGTFGGSITAPTTGRSEVAGNFDNGDTFTKVDHHNYLLGSVTVAGLEFGIKLPGFFTSDFSGSKDGAAVNFDLIDDVLMASTIGAKFTMTPIEVAMQFKMENYSVYFGGKFFAGPITAGLSFMGTLSNTHIKAGLNVAYNAGAFGAGLNGKIDISTATDTFTIIGVEPDFFYNAIPTHLQFKLNAGFYFDSSKTAAGAKLPMTVFWGVQPQIFWNFLGTGAGNFGEINTGMAVRYQVFKDKANALDVIFKFGL